MNTEELWKGDFGNEYTKRNPGSPTGDRVFWERALDKTGTITTVLELGANKGNNLRALRRYLPLSQLDGLEINPVAFKQLEMVADQSECRSILDFEPSRTWDLVFTKGVLIHISPSDLQKAARVLYEASNKYILLSEYFNATPVEIQYRGINGALWKRDFGEYMLNQYPALKCIDYFFWWKHDKYPQDNITTWLFEK